LYDNKQNDLGEKDPIKRFANSIDAGKIGVLKSWGGMHLCCKISKIKRFRKWYGRPQKSFAIMVKDIETARKYGKPTDDEIKLLISNKKPIVLIEKSRAELISPGLNTIGMFLPYTGLHHILFSLIKADALIMTSANVPGEPMMIHNEEVFSLGADIYLLHNRAIPNRIDDSVLKTWKGNTFFLRKSRGYIPEPIQVDYSSRILSVGADENITGAISVDNKVYSTQYIGNAKYYSTLVFLEESLKHLMKLLTKKHLLDGIAADLHPGYDSRKVAQRFAEDFSAPIFEVQHDWAHAASLLVDNNLDESVVLAIEGLGYGTDNTFWGSEVLRADFTSFDRIGHLEYIPLLGGDQATRDPRRLVFAIFNKIGKEKFFSDNEAQILSKLIDKSPLSCSLGRYLDALSCYLGICTKRTYSGEPAMKLEKYLALGKDKIKFDVEVKNNVVHVIDLFRQLDEVAKNILTEKEKADLCYSMVKAIVDSLTDIAIKHAESEGLKTIGISGGVSYNIPITEMIEKRTNNAGYKLIVHNRVPNGDGGVSIGQNAITGHKLSS
jgi:hydrogenase maturation protein HypF